MEMGASSYERRSWQRKDGPDRDVERYRAWITAKLLQGLGMAVVLLLAIVMFDSL
jgi:hypothetical protein